MAGDSFQTCLRQQNTGPPDWTRNRSSLSETGNYTHQKLPKIAKNVPGVKGLIFTMEKLAVLSSDIREVIELIETDLQTEKNINYYMLTMQHYEMTTC